MYKERTPSWAFSKIRVFFFRGFFVVGYYNKWGVYLSSFMLFNFFSQRGGSRAIGFSGNKS